MNAAPASVDALHPALAQALAQALDALGPVAIAVSGGVDSLTLATFAHRRATPDRVRMFHAVSPAVPDEATQRTRALAERERWALEVLDAGEFLRAEYRANPVNRCFFCKTSLYGAIVPVAGARRVVSGTNVDDLGEYRPGLDAARDHGVAHPFVDAGLRKADVRALARALGLGAIADLPAAPCLASRIETGIAIDPAVLARVHAVERAVRDALPHVRDVRCRVRADAIVVEVDAAVLDALSDAARQALVFEVATHFVDDLMLAARPVRLAPYRTGSAFLLNTAVRVAA
jgi:uncharacterized protein